MEDAHRCGVIKDIRNKVMDKGEIIGPFSNVLISLLHSSTFYG
jgi:hypothetical protein